MIFKRTKQLINEFRNRLDYVKDQNEKILIQYENLKKQNDLIASQNKELEWAAIYHDTIKDKEWLKNISLSPGRWAANYSLLYILTRILSDCQPKRILELGLGESSKIISCYLDNLLKDSKHWIIEQDEGWINNFSKRFELSKKSEIINLQIETRMIKGFPVNSYREIEKSINDSFDLYIVDGPFGSNHFSRYDICLLADKLNIKDEFIIIIDDYIRDGEKETVIDLLNKLKEKGIKTYTGNYFSSKGQIIIATQLYRFAASL